MTISAFSSVPDWSSSIISKHLRAACERRRRLCVNVATGDSALQPTCAKDSGASACCTTQRIRTPGARVQKLVAELGVGLLRRALAPLALGGELLEALREAAGDCFVPARSDR